MLTSKRFWLGFIKRWDWLLLGLVAVLFYSFPGAGNYSQVIDGYFSVATAHSIICQGDTTIDEYTTMREDPNFAWAIIAEWDGHVYDNYPIGAPLLAIPLLLSVPCEAAGDLSPAHSQYFGLVLARLQCGITLAFIYKSARLFLTRPFALGIALCTALGTSVWSTTSMGYWPQTASIMVLSLTTYLLLYMARRGKTAALYFAILGLLVAFSYVVRPTNILTVVVVSATLIYSCRQNRRGLMAYFAVAGIVAMLFFAYSWQTFGDLRPSYYQQELGSPDFAQALAGLLISPGRGLIIFTPFLIMVVVSVWLAVKGVEVPPFYWGILPILVLHWVIYAVWWNWWGGYSYGPRFFVDMIPYMMVLFYPLFARWEQGEYKRLAYVFAALVVVSIFIHWQGTYFSAWQWNDIPQNVDTAPERAWDWSDPAFLRPLRAYLAARG